jgi:hypothetical protein
MAENVQQTTLNSPAKWRKKLFFSVLRLMPFSLTHCSKKTGKEVPGSAPCMIVYFLVTE